MAHSGLGSFFWGGFRFRGGGGGFRLKGSGSGASLLGVWGLGFRASLGVLRSRAWGILLERQ